MAVIDPTRTWQPLEQRLAQTTDERHRLVLSTVIEHMKAEAEPNMERLMATVSPEAEYHFWASGTEDIGPKTKPGVQAYYEAFVAGGSNVLEFEITRLVVDDHCLVTEGFLKQIYPGAVAAAIGVPVDDEAGDYLVVFRQLLLWPIDENGLVLGEDSYNPGVVSVTKLSREDLPQAYIDLKHATA
ncbi:nuclear transport factor 2 family protein [Mycolicibacterium frederiksbergense]|uniref:nuclear transport factor 2 family protein n=1 Tax=Mycolicibacterium frederiksbergense TaxID=117567 RepID=UPI0024763FD5|nr:nuclear transport factor 2 family protein [Mycolicibacterium frederiksbergense]